MGNSPKHIAIIPDGNRRWAKKRGLSASDGHREGAKRFREVSKEAFKSGINYLTIWAASEKNLTERNRVEVETLISILKNYLKEELASGEFVKNETRVSFLGRWREILKNPALENLIGTLEEKTAVFQKKHMTILLGYDGKSEMIEAIKKLRKETGEINYDTVKKHLWTNGSPPVDLIIRTGGEPHWSAGFMMWHTADSQLYFTDMLWPDFGAAEFKIAVDDFRKRERRLGA